MKRAASLFVMACLSISCLAEAAPSPAPKVADVFKGVTFTQPKCFGHEYSKADLAKHPSQTVEQIKVKLMKYSADTTTDSNGLKIDLRLKNEAGVNYHAEFSCFDNAGQTLCAIDCDGGSVTVATFDEKSMTLKSNGFAIHGGCDDQSNDEPKMLKALKGADDIFKLQSLPQSYCADSGLN